MPQTILYYQRMREAKLVKKLSICPAIIQKSCSSLDPSIVARYAYDLATLFANFYEKHHVLKATEELRNARLYICECVRVVLSDAIYLIGLQEADKMLTATCLSGSFHAVKLNPASVARVY